MLNVFGNLNWNILLNYASRAISALICVIIHEVCHGWVAYKLGDRTAKEQGRLSLNPLRHIDPIGLLMLIVFRFGWAKPVSVNMMNFKKPKRDMALTSLAGPASNIILALILLIILRLSLSWLRIIPSGIAIARFIDSTASLSVYLGVFNLIPIPPLDGSKILFSVLPNGLYVNLMRYERYGMVLLILLLSTSYLSAPIYAAFSAVYEFLISIVFWGY